MTNWIWSPKWRYVSFTDRQKVQPYDTFVRNTHYYVLLPTMFSINFGLVAQLTPYKLWREHCKYHCKVISLFILLHPEPINNLTCQQNWMCATSINVMRERFRCQKYTSCARPSRCRTEFLGDKALKHTFSALWKQKEKKNY